MSETLNRATLRSTFRKHVEGESLSADGLKLVLKDLSIPEAVLTKENIQGLFVSIPTKGQTITFDDFYDWYATLVGNDSSDLDVRVQNIGELYEEVYSRSKRQTGEISAIQFQKMWEDAGNDEKHLVDIVTYLDQDQDGVIQFKDLARAFEFTCLDSAFDKLWLQTYYTPVSAFRKFEEKDKQAEEKLKQEEKARKRRSIKIEDLKKNLFVVKVDNEQGKEEKRKSIGEEITSKRRSIKESSQLFEDIAKRNSGSFPNDVQQKRLSARLDSHDKDQGDKQAKRKSTKIEGLKNLLHKIKEHDEQQ
jgi:hypothetical protein